MSVRPSSRRQRQPLRASLGPIADLESHLPEEWWSTLFDPLYLMTDGDVVENEANTREEIDMVIAASGMKPGDHVLDLCCGQGRHTMELARRGFQHLTGFDRSRYLIRLARRRSKEAGFQITFRESDARFFRAGVSTQDYVMILGNSFGYFANEEDDKKVLAAVARTLHSGGVLVLDITDGEWIKQNMDPRSWEWIDKHHFVCRERELSDDGDRLICREVITHDERGVIADQFYAERLYSAERITKILEEAGFRHIRQHGNLQADSARGGQDIGMMSRRLLITATAPRKVTAQPEKGRGKPFEVAVVMGDPRLPDTVKLGGKFNAEDLATVEKLKDALAELKGYKFRFLDNHQTLEDDLLSQTTDLVFNLCDEGYNNDAFKELHVPALLEMNELPYTGAGPACLAMCYDKSLVRGVAASLDVPVPFETVVRGGDQGATLPSSFPAILKPNFGDSSIGITKDAVVYDYGALLDYLARLRDTFPGRPILVQEYLTGSEYSVGVIGNPGQILRPLPILEVDYSGLEAGLPRILGYESKWDPNSPYWTQIQYVPARLGDDQQAQLVEYSARLFERLGCRDYARFDFRAAADGTLKLLEVNPNPGWCWDGKFNLMAEFRDLSYSDLLRMLLEAARERLGLVTAAADNDKQAEAADQAASGPANG